MELKFIGRGAAFNPKEGNTSAYFIDNNCLFLIDCGESIFYSLMKNNFLDSFSDIYVMITHTHSDHIGSIGSLVMYSYYNLGRPLNIILPENAKHLSNIMNILYGFGCKDEMFKIVNEDYFDDQFKLFRTIRYMETDHCDELKCYSILITTEDGIVFYSGDTRDSSNLKNLFESGSMIDKIYMDTTTADYPGNFHLNIYKLADVVPIEYQKRIYCMHVNCDDCILIAKELGFNVVEVVE